MGRLSSIPTGTAWLLAAIGLASFFAGWGLGWVELFVVAATCLLCLLVAVPFILRRGQVLIERTINPNRVEAGQRAVAELQATNIGASPSPALTVDERISGVVVPVDVPSLASGQTTEFIYTLPTDKRGRFLIGPASIGRSDPLGLFHRSMGETPIEEFFVHPRTVPTKALSAGFAKDLEGPTFDSSPAGDVAFHTIREYQPGDDVRHVHWMSTARTNTLMVRHYVDNRRPQIAALVDNAITAHSPEAFEVAIEIGASIAVSALRRETPVALWVGDTSFVGRERPSSSETMLDGLAAFHAGPAGNLTESADRMLRTERGTSVVVVVTAGREPGELVLFADKLRRRVQLFVIDVDPAGGSLALPGVRTLHCPDLESFGRAWASLA